MARLNSDDSSGLVFTLATVFVLVCVADDVPAVEADVSVVLRLVLFDLRLVGRPASGGRAGRELATCCLAVLPCVLGLELDLDGLRAVCRPDQVVVLVQFLLFRLFDLDVVDRDLFRVLVADADAIGLERGFALVEAVGVVLAGGLVVSDGSALRSDLRAGPVDRDLALQVSNPVLQVLDV